MNDPLPEPFLSFPSLITMAIPNGSRGVPGVTFARDARSAGAHAASEADLCAPTPAFPFPYPPRCVSHTIRLYGIQPGHPSHNLAATYWAYGYCEGMLALIGSYPDCPDGQAAREGVWAKRFPNQDPEAAQWEPYTGGIPPRAWDSLAVRAARDSGALYKVPKWGEWFARYRANHFQAPTCYWEHTL